MKKDPIGVESTFLKLYRLMLWAIDVLNGDDPQSNSIAKHGWVDADMLKFELDPPGIYLDWQQGNRDIAALAVKYNLLGLPNELRKLLQQCDADLDATRKGFLLREIGIGEIRIHRLLFGLVDGAKSVPFEDCWMAITGSAPPKMSMFTKRISGIQSSILELLVKKGVKVHGRSLYECVYEWESAQKHFGIDDTAQITRMIQSSIDGMFGKFREFASRIPALQPFVGKLTNKNCQIAVLPTMNFDAGSSYIGGNNSDGSAALASLFEWNAGRPATAEDIKYISVHEFLHAMNAQLRDLQRRAGLLGGEAAFLTMSSQQVCVEEGLAQVGLEIMFGGLDNVVTAMGIDMGIVMLLDQLQDIARVAAAVGWNVEWANHVPPLRRYEIRGFILNNLLQSEHIADKYASTKKRWWTEDISGNMHGPSYFYGAAAVRDALKTHNAEDVFAALTHSAGLMDLTSFKMKFGVKDPLKV